MRTTKRSFSLLIASIALLVAAVLSGCGESVTDASQDAASETSSGAVTITDAWSRQPAVGQSTSAAYGIVTNNTDFDVQIVGASSTVSDVVELHETTMDDNDVMSMSEVPEGFTVPAGGSFTFEPGGPHIMILDIDADSYPTDVVNITLVLSNDEALAFDAEVREIAGGMHSEMDMDHSES